MFAVITIVVILIAMGYAITKDKYSPPPAKALSPETEAFLRRRKYTTEVEVAGLQYHDFDLAQKARLIKEHSSYTLKREPKNRKDSNAVAIYIETYKVGYVPSFQAGKIAEQMDRGDRFTVYLEGYHPRKKYGQLELELVNEAIKAQVEP